MVEDPPPPQEVLYNVNSENQLPIEKEDYSAVYDFYDNVNEHTFASHQSYSPAHRYSTLTLPCEIIAENGQRCRIICMLDNCANLCVLRKNIADKLQMKGEKVDLELTVTGGKSVTFKRQRKVKFQLANPKSMYVTEFSVEAVTMPTISQKFEKIDINPQNYDHLRSLEFGHELPMSSSYFQDNSEIDLLLGLPFQTLIREPPYYALGCLGEPHAVLTKLGNCISVNNSTKKQPKSVTFLCKNCEKDIPNLSEFLLLDNLGIEDPSLNNHLSMNELKADQMIDQGTTYIESSKQYCTVLPWIDEPIKITNMTRAKGAASRIATKFMNNDQKWQEMTDRVKFMLEKKFIEVVPEEDLKKTENFHYLIAFALWDYTRTTSKVRIVFQANQIMPEINKSLNNHLLCGKNNLPEIPRLLMKFRTHEVACVTDVSAMFNRLLLKESDTEFLRFYFCLERPTSKNGKVNLISFRNRVLPFGIKCAPYLATYLLQKHAEKYLNGPLRKAAMFIITSTYMDDTSFGASTVDEMKKLVLQVKYIFDECSMPTHKYFSNKKEALKGLPEDLCSTQEETSVLGSVWNSTLDTLSFNSFLPPPNLKKIETLEDYEEEGEEEEADMRDKSETEINNTLYTKRNLASIVAKLYDINGFVSPFCLIGKLLLQQTWVQGVDWDQVLPQSILVPFRRFVLELPKLKNVRIPRKIVPKNGQIVELCIFNDACGTSFATVVYVVSEDEFKKRHSHLLFSKAKVKPLNKNFDNLAPDLTIPRMELLGCDIGARAGNYVIEAFKDHPNIKMRYFTDSLISLYRINKEDSGIYKPWVANRINNILKLSKKEEWEFCPGNLNFGADIASRSALLSEFVDNPLWLEGPEFLKDPNYQPVTVDQIKLSQVQKQIDFEERKKTVPTFHYTFVSHKATVVEAKTLGLEEIVLASKSKSLDFYEGRNKSDPTKNGILYLKSSWAKTVRILGWVFRFIHKCQNRVKTRKKLMELTEKSLNYRHKLRKKTVQKPKVKPKVKMPKLKINKNLVISDLRLTSEEQIFAEDHFLHYAQFTRFSNEISTLREEKDLDPSNELYKLLPFWSTPDNFLRMLGRITQPSSNLIILPRDHIVTASYIQHIHVKFNHASIPHTLYLVNQRCHVMGSRQYVKKVLFCCSCRQPINLFERMSSLPPIDYLDPAKHHYFIQIDFAGPFQVVDESGQLTKTWCALFTCLQTRNVTTKLLRSCSTKDLILGIRSYVAQRGAWQLAVSDAAKYFQSASKELKSIIAGIKWNEVTENVLTLGMEWKFNCPLSPHRSGGVESMVKLVKIGLQKSIKNEILDFNRLNVVFEEIAAVVNSRPLGYVASTSTSSDQEIMISPSILCYGRNVDILPTPVKIEDISTLQNTPLKKFHHAHRIKMSRFWKAYFDLYFNFLKYRKKWFKSLKFEIQPNMFVLVKEPNLRKFEYKTGRVVSVQKSQDGIVRTIEVKFAQNKTPVFRDIKNIAILEHDFLRLSNSDHQCLHSHKTCLLSSEILDSQIQANE